MRGSAQLWVGVGIPGFVVQVVAGSSPVAHPLQRLPAQVRRRPRRSAPELGRDSSLVSPLPRPAIDAWLREQEHCSMNTTENG
jgi:hypothetical protein